MNTLEQKKKRREHRKARVRSSVTGSPERPRLTVFRSNQHIYAQLIDDTGGKTICAASSRDKELAAELKVGSNKNAAAIVGRTLAARARMKGVRQAAFDRNGYRYHGRVKALADAARESGLQF
jgi:large subunit ribosomal protein L18